MISITDKTILTWNSLLAEKFYTWEELAKLPNVMPLDVQRARASFNGEGATYNQLANELEAATEVYDGDSIFALKAVLRAIKDVKNQMQ